MTIDFFEGKITPEQVQLDPILVRDIVGGMKHGDEAYMPADFYWIDTDRKMWIDKNAPRFSADEVPDAIEDLDDLLVRCIKINGKGITGFIIDASYHNMPPDGEDYNRFDQRTGEGYDTKVAREPVIGWVGTQMELDILESFLKTQFAMELGDCAIKEAFRQAEADESGGLNE